MPATITGAIIDAGTGLEHVTLGFNVNISLLALLGDGVRFVSNLNIPPGIELTDALPRLPESAAIDLGGDVLVDEISRTPGLM